MIDLKLIFVTSCIAYCKSGADCYYCPIYNNCKEYGDTDWEELEVNDRPAVYIIDSYARDAFDESKKKWRRT